MARLFQTMRGDTALKNQVQTAAFYDMYLISLMNREDIFISGIMTQKIIGQHHGSQLEKIWMNTRANVIMEQLIQE